MAKEIILCKEVSSPLNEREVKVSKAILIYEIKRYFKWLNSSKYYKCVIDRLCALDTKSYNSFIDHLIKKGY